jgi:hypothetical protein
MRPLLVAFSFSSLLIAQQAAPPAAAPLWNGKDLAGWHGQRHESPYKLAAMTAAARAKLREADDASMRAHWRVVDGELVNDGEGAYLTSDAEFGDVELTLDYRTVAGADSGIYLRGCPQVQIWDTTEAGGKWQHGADKGSGALWNNEKQPRFPLVLADKPFGEWNTLRIVMLGERVWVDLNGQRTVDGAVMENYWDRKRPLPARGPLQLQTHGGEIRFRNLMLREIPASEANARLAALDAVGFVPVFDGKTLAGFRGDVDSYEVVDGAIRCRAGAGGNLFTDASYGDFTVRLEFRLPPGGNNGLALRYPGTGNPARGGVEVQVLDDGHAKYAQLKPWQAHGSVYGVAPAHRGYLRPAGEWNFQQVTAKGARYTVVLNGTTILDVDVKALPSALEQHEGKDRVEGHFGFCGHQDAVAFRAVAIKPL